MKKYLTFTNIIAFSAFVALMLFFTPCFTLTGKVGDTQPLHYLNLFSVAFGCKVANIDPNLSLVSIYPCAGLILAFLFLIIGMGLSIAKNRIKLLGYAASASYLTSGILIACGLPMIIFSNYDSIGVTSTLFRAAYYGWDIAIATIVCFIGVLAFIDTIASTAKPKVQEVY